MKWIEHKYFQLGFGIGVLVLLFVNNHSLSLWDQDEAAYAGFALNMLKTGQYLIPDFFWSEVHRKTPLLFWDIAASFKLFGINEFALRLPTVIAVLITLLVVYYFAKSVFDKNRAFVIAAVLSTSLLVVVLAKVAVTDAGILMCCTLSAIAIYQILNKRTQLWALLFWVAFSVGLLQKGPPIVIFSVLLLFSLAVFHPLRKNLLGLKPWFGLPLALFPFLYWLYLTNQSENGAAFISWFVDWYILKRISDSVFGQSGPPGTHLVFMALSFVPYFMFFPQAFWLGMRDLFKRKDSNSIFFGCWLVAGWFFYEISPSKLPTYVIAAHVPIAFLIGNKLIEFSESRFRPISAFVWIQYFIMGIVVIAIPILPFVFKLDWATKTIFLICGIVLLSSLILSFVIGFRKHCISWILAFGLLLQLMVWGVLMPQVDKLKDATRQVALYLRSALPENSVVVIGNDFGRPPSLPFYLMQHFGDVSEQKDFEALWSAYSEMGKGALILNAEQYQFFVGKGVNLNMRQFSSFITDRKERSDYYVVIKK
jgi:hypothetical protein